MRGLEWVKIHTAPVDEDARTLALAEDADFSITVPSRIARKAREYIAARNAFLDQLEKNGIYVE